MGECSDCKFSDFSITTGAMGYCRANPPVIVSGLDWGQWPTVGSDDWCGKFEAKEPKKR
jgi:hypothetical protein